MLSMLLALALVTSDPVFRSEPTEVTVTKSTTFLVDQRSKHTSRPVTIRVTVSATAAPSDRLWLVRRIYKPCCSKHPQNIKLPPDGFQEYDLFCASPTSSRQFDRTTQKAEPDYWTLPAGLDVKGIRVYGSDGATCLERPAAEWIGK